MGNTPIVQRARLSNLFTEWYAQEVQPDAQGVCIKTTQLGAAKHRFDSWQTPLTQCALPLPAVIRVAQKIRLFRGGGDEGRDAARFLENLSPGRV